MTTERRISARRRSLCRRRVAHQKVRYADTTEVRWLALNLFEYLNYWRVALRATVRNAR